MLPGNYRWGQKKTNTMNEMQGKKWGRIKENHIIEYLSTELFFAYKRRGKKTEQCERKRERKEQMSVG